MPPAASVADLFLYPIKSCAAVAVRSAKVGSRGLELGRIGDRRWILADAAGMMITQRQNPALARVSIALRGDHLLLSGDDLQPLPLDPDQITGERASVLLHGTETVGHLSAPAINDWFSRFLGQSVRLLYQTDEDLRLCDPAFAVRPGSDRVGFADAYPFLLANLATLDRLNQAMEHPVPMNRFRPNIVIAGCPADEEYGWQQVDIGAQASFRIVKPCTRCVMTTIDQQSGAKTGKEPLAALGRIYFLSADFGGTPVQGVIFGENAIATELGEVRLGDKVILRETKPPHVFRAE